MPARARNNDAMTQPLTLHPDRLFPAEPQTRAVARKLYEQVKDLPIISPHGHVPPAWIADDIPFKNPTDLLLTPRSLREPHSARPGRRPGRARRPGGPDRLHRGAGPRGVAHLLLPLRAVPWDADEVLDGDAELVDIFGIDVRPSAETADEIYDAINAKLATDAFKPRALLDTFNISFLATTDDPLDDLEHHAKAGR
jgi:glucuronate isomerase